MKRIQWVVLALALTWLALQAQRFGAAAGGWARFAISIGWLAGGMAVWFRDVCEGAKERAG